MKKLVTVVACSLFLAVGVASAETGQQGTTSKGTTVVGEFSKHCAQSLTAGKMVPTDCSVNWTNPATSKTYCFATETAKTTFATDTNANIAKALEQYTKLHG